ncbi:uncharacterized protein G2W53_002115 [Senna tora]|uniref:PRC-barrel domain-containing protein n=1 Tax=Senna tora TaxID=362788 RepID=A0A834XIR3_9FABA|nr:uncharacterized protein G2W53_002115 [Senna tora]
MSDLLATKALAISFAEAPRLPFLNSTFRNQLNPNFHSPFSAKLPSNDSNGGSGFLKSTFAKSHGFSDVLGSRDYRFRNELEFLDKGENNLELERARVDADDNTTTSSSSGFEDIREVNFDSARDKESGKSENDVREEDLVRSQNDGDDERVVKFSGKVGSRRGRQVIRRSNLLAKQVISIRSALCLGFVSQLWVDTTSWVVLFVEVRPNLLSGDSERFLLEDINQVGDVVLVQDESVIENEFRMIGLETLVGYKVVTPSGRTIGKVRGYTFSINSGAIEVLELDSFGLSIIPSSVVSTFSLQVEDVLEVVSDAVVVHDAAASHIQRLSKGFLGNQLGTSLDDEVEEYSDSEISATSGNISRTRRRFGRKKPNPRDWDNDEDWELPMDYL